jgi:hypothetical protein
MVASRPHVKEGVWRVSVVCQGVKTIRMKGALGTVEVMRRRRVDKPCKVIETSNRVINTKKEKV